MPSILWPIFRARAEIKINFVHFLVQMRTRKFASEMYWPLNGRKQHKQWQKKLYFWRLHATMKIPWKHCAKRKLLFYLHSQIRSDKTFLQGFFFQAEETWFLRGRKKLDEYLMKSMLMWPRLCTIVAKRSVVEVVGVQLLIWILKFWLEL